MRGAWKEFISATGGAVATRGAAEGGGIKFTQPMVFVRCCTKSTVCMMSPVSLVKDANASLSPGNLSVQVRLYDDKLCRDGREGRHINTIAT